MLQGLTQEEAQSRLIKNGPNAMLAEEHQSAFQTFLNEFKSPLVIMLICASMISFISGDYVSASLILGIIVMSSVVNFIVSHKSEQAAKALASKVALTARVIRDGVQTDILASQIVIGDIVTLEAGKMVPADGVVSEGSDLFVNESSLTGESLPVEKNIGAEVYLGSGVVTGRAYMEVKATGVKTKFYAIVSLLAGKERLGEFERGIRAFSILITKVVVVMAIVVFVVNAVFKHEVLQSLIFALAIAVGITPELLPMIIATNISKASLKMAKKGVIVKKLSAVENFGSMDILCTDKTGTLTEDKITLVKYLDIKGADSDSVLEYAYMTSSFHTGTKTPLDDAIAVFRTFDLSQYKKIDEIPFDFERKRNSMVVETKGVRTLIVKGAPENVFIVSKLSTDDMKEATELFNKLSQDGYRVLAVATKILSDTRNDYTTKDEYDLSFAGFVAFIDPPKPGVGAVLKELESRGVAIKIITGDHQLVAEKIARDVGLPFENTLVADDIDKLSDAELAVRAETTTIFARVAPAQKNRIITMLQSRGHVVGYMGDGINDAPALRTADIGISVNNAVDVAKEAADIILLSKSFRQLIDGVIEGRRTFANTIKYITMVVSSNFGNMFSMTGASIFFPFLPMLPTQILLNDFLYEGSQFALTFDRVEDSILQHPNPWNIDFIKRFMLVFGTISSVFDFMTFYILYKVFSLSGSAFQTGWFIESFATQVLVVFVIRSYKPIWKAVRPHFALVASTFGSLIIACWIALVPFGIGRFFGFATLNWSVLIPISIIVIIYLIIVEYAKLIFYRKMVLPFTAVKKKAIA